MIYITQLIYLAEGQEEIFDEFEKFAIPILARYNGKILLRVRPDDNSFIDFNTAKPYEIHLVEFRSERDFKMFGQDEERKKFLHLKDKSIKASIMIQGVEI